MVIAQHIRPLSEATPPIHTQLILSTMMTLFFNNTISSLQQSSTSSPSGFPKVSSPASNGYSARSVTPSSARPRTPLKAPVAKKAGNVKDGWDGKDWEGW